MVFESNAPQTDLIITKSVLELKKETCLENDFSSSFEFLTEARAVVGLNKLLGGRWLDSCSLQVFGGGRDNSVQSGPEKSVL